MLRDKEVEHAQFLPERTNLLLKAICPGSIYEILAGFITEFRKRFGPSLNQWGKERGE